MEEEKGLLGGLLGTNIKVYGSNPAAYTQQSATVLDMQEALKNLLSKAKFEIISAFTKDGVIKKLKKFQESHTVLNVSFSTNTKYSTTFDKEYTEYTVFIQYI